MKRLDKWLERTAKRDSKRPQLDEALLLGRTTAYASYRLRYLLIRTALRALLHLIEVLLFSSVFSPEFLAPVIIIRSGTAIAISVWWGALEEMREQVRTQSRISNWHGIRKQIDQWLVASLFIGSLVLIGVGSYIFSTPDEMLGFSIFDAYALACLIRLALDMFGRAYHSGMFAIRRIYRPLWTMIIGDIADVALVLILWPFLGPWGFAISLLTVGILRTTLLIVYVKKAYGQSNIPPFRPRGLVRSLALPSRGTIGRSVKHALANLSSQIDSALIVALIASSGTGDSQFGLAVLFYLLRPFIGASFSWPRLFYFDFVKLDWAYSPLFKQRFERFMVKVALWFSLVLALAAILWVAFSLAASAALWGYEFIWPEALGWGIWLFVPFFALRSIIGLFQMQAFSYKNYKYLAKMSALLGIWILAPLLIPDGGYPILVGVIISMLLFITLFRSPKTPNRSPAITDTDLAPLPLARWLWLLYSQTSEVRVTRATANRRLSSVASVAGELATRFPHGSFTRTGKTTILWFEAGFRDRWSNRTQITSVGAGCLEEFAQSDIFANGPEAISESLNQGIFDNSLIRMLGDLTIPSNKESLLEHFISSYPQGFVLDSKKGAIGYQSGGPSHRHLKKIIGQSRALWTGGHKHATVGNFDITLFGPQGDPQVFFCIDKRLYPDTYSQWRNLVLSASLQHSIQEGTK